MAWPVISPELWERMKQKGEQLKPKSVLAPAFTGVKTVFTKASGIFDGLILFTMVFLYFFFTGLALVWGRKLPKEWLSLATKLNRGEIAKRVVKPRPVKTVTEKPKYKVVDLETQKELKV